MRLTKKSKKATLEYEAIEQLVRRGDASPLIAKLGKLEDHEDALKIDLDTLLKSFGGVFYKKGDKIKFSCHLALVDWRFYVLDEEIIEVNNMKFGFALELADYGKEWSLYKKDLDVTASYPRDNKGRFIKRS